MDDAIVGTVVDALPQNVVVSKGSVLLQFCKRPIRNESEGAVYHVRLSVERLLPTEVVCLLYVCARYIIIGILAAHPQRVALPAEGQRPRTILTMQRVGNVVSRREERGKATGRRPTVGNERSEKCCEESNLAPRSPLTAHRKLTTPRHYAYLKISEGCDRHCAYCAIPIITGRHVSRPQEEILEEVRWLVSQGVNELQVIAQELTYYGVDLDGRQQIAELIERIADVPGIKWIRLHYAYPTHFPWDLLRVMRERPNVCRYMDIALQHISDPILKAMHRHVTKAETYDLIRRMRQEVPGIHLRTTLMVGFPGETDADFEELMDFVRWARFERMGAFAYSEEEGTYSALHYPDNIPDEVKQDRLSRLMALQQEISAEIEAEKVGQTLRVVIDRKEGDYYVGRSEFCSPEVDPEVLIPAAERRLRVGCMYDALITGAEEFDVYAQVR